MVDLEEVCSDQKEIYIYVLVIRQINYKKIYSTSI